MKSLTLVFLVTISFDGYTQTNEVSTRHHTSEAIVSDTISHLPEKAIEIFKINSNKTFRIDKTRNVWVRCTNKKGKTKIKKASLVAITDHEMTFKPYNDDFNEVTYTDTTIQYIGFTSAGRVMVATISNVLILSAVVIIYTAIIIAEILAGTNHISNPRINLGHVPFRKNVNFYKTRNGDRQWGVRIIDYEL